MELDHVALEATDIAASARWYQEECQATVLYQDSTWALLQVGRGKVALVTPGQHPAHIAVRVDQETLERTAGEKIAAISRHRDGTSGIYLHDPDGNAVEMICYPSGD